MVWIESKVENSIVHYMAGLYLCHVNRI